MGYVASSAPDLGPGVLFGPARLPMTRPSIALVVIAFASGSVGADDAEIGMLLKAKGVEVTESKGIVTGLTVQDGSKLTDDDFRQITQLSHMKMLSLSNGLDDGRLGGRRGGDPGPGRPRPPRLGSRPV